MPSMRILLMGLVTDVLYGTATCRSGRCRPGSAPSRCAGLLREIAETGDLVSENGKTYLVARVTGRSEVVLKTST